MATSTFYCMQTQKPYAPRRDKKLSHQWHVGKKGEANILQTNSNGRFFVVWTPHIFAHHDTHWHSPRDTFTTVKWRTMDCLLNANSETQWCDFNVIVMTFFWAASRLDNVYDGARFFCSCVFAIPSVNRSSIQPNDTVLLVKEINDNYQC